jgi:hypothetical protein
MVWSALELIDFAPRREDERILRREIAATTGIA